MIAAYIALQLGVDIREATRLLIAWNVGAWAFLILILHMVMDPRRDARVQSRPEDENQWVLVVLGIVAALAAIAAIVWELRPGEGHDRLAQGRASRCWSRPTVLSAWTFLR